MDTQAKESLPHFLSVLGLEEDPMGLFYSNVKPDDGYSPTPMDLPTRKKK
jgi:hypothetical protein